MLIAGVSNSGKGEQAPRIVLDPLDVYGYVLLFIIQFKTRIFLSFRVAQMTTGSYRLRIFLTCWIIFGLHFATDFVREHYLVLSIGDNLSFRLDGYENLHPDIFVTEDHGVHHGANPGASMIAAIPYSIFKPLIDVIHARVLETRQASEKEITAVYNDPRPMRVEFYRKVRERGLDIKFGLTGFVTQFFCMAPLSALSAVVIFSVFVWLGLTYRLSTWLALIYAVGTPVLFRTAFLNQNLMVGIFALFAFVLLWKPYSQGRLGMRSRYMLAGFFGGLCLLCDYSGGILMGLLGIYGMILRVREAGFLNGVMQSLWYVAGMLAPVFLLGLYQYQSFGNPFYPPQHYMPPVEWIEIGYQGVGMPQWELLKMLWFDHRFGLFVVAPLLSLAVLVPVLQVRGTNIVPWRETLLILVIFLSVSVFFSTVQYTRLQWNTGIRYLMAIIPLMYILAGAVLVRIPQVLAYPLVVFAVAESWSQAMFRGQQGIVDNMTRAFLEGFQLPWLGTLSRMATQYAPFLEGQKVSALPFIALAGALIYGVWAIRSPRKCMYDNYNETRE